MESDITPRTKEDNERKAYSKLLAFELKEWEQEKLREKLGKPFGRLPPFKLDLLSNDQYESYAADEFTKTFQNSKRDKYQDGSFSNRGSYSYKTSRDLPPLSRDKSLSNIPQFKPTFDRLTPVLEAIKTIGPDKKLSLPNLRPKYSNSESPIARVRPIEIPKQPESESFQFGYPNEGNLLDFNPFMRPSGKNYFFPLEMFVSEDINFDELEYPQAGFSR